MIIETRARQGGKSQAAAQALVSSILGPGWLEGQMEGVRRALSEGVMDMAQGPVAMRRITVHEIGYFVRSARYPRAYAFLEAVGLNPADADDAALAAAERDLIARELLSLAGA